MAGVAALIGQEAPDFPVQSLPEGSGAQKQLSEILTPGKVSVLIFYCNF